MNKKVIMVLIIFFAVFLAIGSVSAANMVNKNFDGFSMDVPKNADFEKQKNNTKDEAFPMKSVSYISKDFFIIYYDSPVFSENSSSFFTQSIFESINLDLDKCYESQEGNMTILEPTKNDDSHGSVVSIYSNNKLIIIAGLDSKLLKEMGKSVEFK